jgi:hypothetical protein
VFGCWPQCGFVNVTGLKQGFEERWETWGNVGNIRPLDAITHVSGRCVIGYSFTEVVQCLKSAPTTCTITFARGVNTLRAVSVQSWRTKEIEFGRTREVANMPKLFGVRIADESIVVCVCVCVCVCALFDWAYAVCTCQLSVSCSALVSSVGTLLRLCTTGKLV